MLHEPSKDVYCGGYLPLFVLWMVFQSQVLITVKSVHFILMCAYFMKYSRNNSRFIAMLYVI